MTKAVIIFSLSFLIIITTNSCKKTTESQLLNGFWKLNKVYIDTSTTNYLNKFPDFGNSTSAYKLSFQESDVVLSYYIRNDSILQLTAGTWSVPSYNQVYIKIDSFIDGTFDISRPTLHHWVLTTDYNHIAAYDNGVNPALDTAYTKLDITRL